MRADVVIEARRWLGTPFVHQASVRGTGCDCVGLVRGVWRELIGPEPEVPPAYPSRVDLLNYSVLTDFADRHMIKIDVDAAVLGDVLAMRLRAGVPAHHAAIMTQPGRYIHAWGGNTIRAVVETGLPPRADIVAAYAYPA